MVEVEPIHLFQEMGRLAEWTNKNSQPLSQIVDPREEDNVLPEDQMVEFNESLSMFGDEHFAISEKLLEQKRKECHGNWLDQAHKQFKDKYSAFVNYKTSLDLNDTEFDGCCQSLYGPGFCKQQLTPVIADEYQRLFADVVSVLRIARETRRRDGHVPHHIPLLFFERDVGANVDCLRSVYLLTRVSFSPFDGTALQFTTANEEGRAEICFSEDGTMLLIELKPLLLEIARGDAVLDVKTASYSAVSLREIELGPACAPSDVDVKRSTGENGSDSGSENDDNYTSCMTTRKRLAMLRKAVNGTGTTGSKRKTAPSHQGEKPTKKKAPAPAKSKGATATGVNPTADDEPGHAGEMHDSIVVEWDHAFSSRAGPIKTEKKSEHSQQPKSMTGTKTTETVGSKAGGIEIVSRTLPWRDANNYCWMFNASSGKAFPLGLVLRNTCTAPLVTQLHSCTGLQLDYQTLLSSH